MLDTSQKPAASSGGRKLWQLLRHGWSGHIIALLFLLPALVHVAIFKCYPVAYSFVLSLHRRRLLDPFDRYLGFYHYEYILADSLSRRRIITLGFAGGQTSVKKSPGSTVTFCLSAANMNPQAKGE